MINFRKFMENTDQPQAEAGPAPMVSTPSPQMGQTSAPLNTSQGTQQPVPQIDPAIQRLQQKLVPLRQQLNDLNLDNYIKQIKDQKVREALQNLFGKSTSGEEQSSEEE